MIESLSYGRSRMPKICNCPVDYCWCSRVIPNNKEICWRCKDGRHEKRYICDCATCGPHGAYERPLYSSEGVSQCKSCWTGSHEQGPH